MQVDDGFRWDYVTIIVGNKTTLDLNPFLGFNSRKVTFSPFPENLVFYEFCGNQVVDVLIIRS